MPTVLGRKWWTGGGKEHVPVRENLVREGSEPPEGEGSDSGGDGGGGCEGGKFGLGLGYVMKTAGQTKH